MAPVPSWGDRGIGPTPGSSQKRTSSPTAVASKSSFAPKAAGCLIGTPGSHFWTH